ncbi:bifunctional helix-turn-helix transcriptional regulator/GNAT family N-acetyltransferase [Pinirhizobacter sp.]|jgi:ribosomal protein S18 acetylase RimI-like enzyme|uniref:bifunctional helix-turn-helix transcriptional regulator/GNAT family N-acetyltransferase n=1 Tax=Pinirhizobacter sp. TaxID=2950432 RepID=UPI002F409913
MHFDSLAELALASRLHALSEQLYQSIDDVFQATGSTLQSRWIPILRFLRDHGPASPTDVCLALGLPHTTINPLASLLVREGLVERRTTGALAATVMARQALRQLEPTWLAIRRTVNRDYPGIAKLLLGALAGTEDALRRQSLSDAILREHGSLMSAEVEIVAYEPAYAGDFRRLNLAWLERYFVVEAVDHAMLSDPEGAVLARGGAILFARSEGEVIGTCSLLHEGEGVYELSKMAVDEAWQGVGTGRKLLDATLQEYRRLGGRHLFLESSSLLKKALGMYERAGFVMQPGVREGSHYARADVYMVYDPRR